MAAVRERAVIPVLPTTSARVAASWYRSERYGVPVDVVRPVFTGEIDESSLFFECAREVLAGLHASLADEPVGLILADADGVVLTRLCAEKPLVEALDECYLAPGFAFSERAAGTNGMGLALADRAPALVRGEEHYCTALRGYTCAAAPVSDPADGRLLGSLNLTTWSRRSEALLLALARTAAGHTTALMSARGRGGESRPVPRGEVFHIHTSSRDGELAPKLSAAWSAAHAEVVGALTRDASVGVVGEPGAGKSALLASALRAARRQDRILHARPPDERGAEAWLALWTPELGKPNTSVIAGRVDRLPAWATTELAELVRQRPYGRLAVTAAAPETIPVALSPLVDVVVELPPLRHRRDDILPLAHHFAQRAGGRDVDLTAAAARALRSYHWPGNAEQLRQVIRDAANRSNLVDARHLAPEVHCSAGRALTRIETIERDEIVRCLTEAGMTVTRAAERLGISRATAYRRIAQYGIQLPS